VTTPFETPAPSEPSDDPAEAAALLRALVPKDPNERKRAFTALLRGVLDDRPTTPRS
jgi:hypothetical protein